MENCKHLIKNEIRIGGKFFDGCRKSRKDLPNDICDSTSCFCKKVREKDKLSENK